MSETVYTLGHIKEVLARVWQELDLNEIANKRQSQGSTLLSDFKTLYKRREASRVEVGAVIEKAELVPQEGRDVVEKGEGRRRHNAAFLIQEHFL